MGQRNAKFPKTMIQANLATNRGQIRAELGLKVMIQEYVDEFNKIGEVYNFIFPTIR